jgi:hypothetical protein
MFAPVGPRPSSVYWRRRLVVLVSVLALFGLIALTVRVLLAHDPGKPAAAGTGRAAGASTSGSAPAASRSPSSPAGTAASSSTSRSAPARSTSSSPSTSASTAAPPPPCTAAFLRLAAASDRTRYTTGDKPVLSILVTNRGDGPCVQNLADSQIELRVYNGQSRVWGSHDCTVQPGTDERTLKKGSTVRVSVVWSGLSSQPHCAGTRQRVGAGTYTLYASLSGRGGVAAQFAIT